MFQPLLGTSWDGGSPGLLVFVLTPPTVRRVWASSMASSMASGDVAAVRAQLDTNEPFEAKAPFEFRCTDDVSGLQHDPKSLYLLYGTPWQVLGRLAMPGTSCCAICLVCHVNLERLIEANDLQQAARTVRIHHSMIHLKKSLCL